MITFLHAFKIKLKIVLLNNTILYLTNYKTFCNAPVIYNDKHIKIFLVYIYIRNRNSSPKKKILTIYLPSHRFTAFFFKCLILCSMEEEKNSKHLKQVKGE